MQQAGIGSWQSISHFRFAMHDAFFDIVSRCGETEPDAISTR
jgi:hypothetical protein